MKINTHVCRRGHLVYDFQAPFKRQFYNQPIDTSSPTCFSTVTKLIPTVFYFHRHESHVRAFGLFFVHNIQSCFTNHSPCGKDMDGRRFSPVSLNRIDLRGVNKLVDLNDLNIVCETNRWRDFSKAALCFVFNWSLVQRTYLTF